MPVAAFLAVTFALATAPPCASVIVPVSVAPATCAWSGTEQTRPITQIKTRILVAYDFMVVSSHGAFGFLLHPAPLLPKTFGEWNMPFKREIIERGRKGRSGLGTNWKIFDRGDTELAGPCKA